VSALSADEGGLRPCAHCEDGHSNRAAAIPCVGGGPPAPRALAQAGERPKTCYDFTICGVADSLGGGRVCLLEGGKTYPDFFLPSLGVHVEIKPTEKLSYSDLKRMVEFALEGDHRTDRRLSDTGSHVFDRPLLRAD
jgi:hypothetical protein